jgi:Methyltransferase domain
MMGKFDDATKNIFLARLGVANEFSAYDRLIDYIDANKIFGLSGQFLEIGAFMGGGSVKLARCAAKHSKRLLVVDLFDPDFDVAENIHGQSMGSLYRRAIGHKSLREIFDGNTKHEKNIVVYEADSMQVALPPDTKLCFSYIDGGHDAEHVTHDFYLAWNLTVPGGAVAFHDYVETGGDLPQVTDAINALIEANKSTISDTLYMRDSAIMLVRKK